MAVKKPLQDRRERPSVNPAPLALPWFPHYFPPAVAKVYIVSFRTRDDRRPSKFIVLADNMKSAIKMAWEHGGPDFQSRFDKSTAQALAIFIRL
jgi:hypothetical protein